ncbi:MAG: hypothetical protein CME71_01125 [Halobacteriovorax sp.]|nr:hypothetical protein [Halobacteriovorax sp.]
MRLFILLFFISTTLSGQEVGPRKPWQMIGSVLNIAQEKDVLLFNKGFEDGLAEGDHAWFWSHNSKGFRAVCLKVSESRSLWQPYRVEDESLLKTDIALLARQATSPIFVPSPEDSDRL